MRKLIFESSIYVPEGDAVLDQICDRLIDLCTGISRSETDLYLIFEVGRSIIRVGHGALLMRVEADDLVGCHSMKVALEGTVVEIFGLNSAVTKSQFDQAASAGAAMARNAGAPLISAMMTMASATSV